MEKTPIKVVRLLTLATLTYLTLFNFSLGTRQNIWKRDEGKCRRCSKSKKKGYYLEVSHLNHSREYEFYDAPSNGILVCLADHLAEHRRMEGRNGLSVEKNREAILSIQARMKQMEKEGRKI